MGARGRILLLAIALLVAGGAAWRAFRTPAVSAGRFRIVQRLEQPVGGLLSDPLQLANDAQLRWTADEIRDRWTRVDSGRSATLRSPRLDLPEDFHAVIVKRKAASTAPALILWSDGPTLDAPRFARNRRALPAAASSPVAMVLENETLQSDERRPIHHVFLHLPEGGNAGDSVEAVAIVTMRDLASAGAAVTRLAADGQTRDGIAARTPLTYRASVPRGAELSFAVRVAPSKQDTNATVRVTQSAGNREDVVLDAPVQRGGWIDFRTSLRASESSTLVFSVSRTGDGTTPVYWSVPQILAPQRDERPNVVLYVVDALRADKLGLYGSRAGVSPFLDELSQRSLVFRRAYAPASWTKPSVTTLLTSLYPATHALGARHYADALPRHVPTLQGELAARGYATAQFSPNPFTGAVSSLDRGFDVAMMAPALGSAQAFEVKAADLHAAFVAWLLERPRDTFFAYLHAVDAHPPYKNDRETPAAAYEAAIASVDRELTRLYEHLARMDVTGRTIFIVTADHGEAFGEHGHSGHGQSVYDEEIRVPLIVHAPGRVAPGWVEEPVHLIDVMPTVLDYTGASFDARKLQGRSFAARDARTWTASPVIVSKFTYPEDIDAPGSRDEMHAVVDYPWKLIAVDRPGVARGIELYRLDADPGERQNLAQAEPARARQLELALDGFLREQAAARARFATAHESALTPRPAPARELIDQLRSLGYVR